MTKSPKKLTKQAEIRDEPGAEERFMRGVRKALNTPPTKHADEPRRRPKRKKTAGAGKPTPAARSGKHRKNRG